MTASGVLHPVRCVFAPEGVYLATFAPAPLSAVPGTRARSRRLESAAPNVAAMEVRVLTGPFAHTRFKFSHCLMDLRGPYHFVWHSSVVVIWVNINLV